MTQASSDFPVRNVRLSGTGPRSHRELKHQSIPLHAHFGVLAECGRKLLLRHDAMGSRRVVATLIITEKTSQAKDLAAALGSRYGKILPAEGHLLRLAEPDEIDPAWKRWSCTLLSRTACTPPGPPPAATSPPS